MLSSAATLAVAVAEFIRQVELRFGTEGTTGRSIKGLRISFDVKYTRSSKPNTAKITVYNPSPDSVALLSKEDAVVILLAGYDVPLQIFRGNPIDSGVYMERNGPDRILTIELQDGGRQWADDFVSTSFASQKTSGEVFETLKTAIGLPGGVADIDTDIKMVSGLVLHGSATEMMDDLMASQDAEWFIRDGVIQAIPKGGSTGETAVVFSSVSKNLIGAPVKTKDGVKVTALISPSLRPAKPFRVISNELNGDYIADDVEFRGDSGFTPAFYVVATGRQL